MEKVFLPLLCFVILMLSNSICMAADSVTCWFPPAWKSKSDNAVAITQALTKESGIVVTPRIATSYPEILEAFSKNEPNLVYVGSFVQAIIASRNLGKPLVQCINGKEFYSGILVYPKGMNPSLILKENPKQIAFAIGASSGESTAKAATGGRASIGVNSHGDACAAVIAEKAEAAVVKNWWWETNKEKYPALTSYEIPEYSKMGNPDNVLTASKAVPATWQNKISAAAIKRKDVFGAQEMRLFEPGRINFSLWLMKQGKIDPLTYQW